MKFSDIGFLGAQQEIAQRFGIPHSAERYSTWIYLIFLCT